MKLAKTFTLATTLATALVHASEDVAEEESAVPEVFSVPSTEGAAFVETFQNDPFDGRWVKSGDDTYAGQTWDWGAPKAASGKYVADKVSVLLPPFSPSSFVLLPATRSFPRTTVTNIQSSIKYILVWTLACVLHVDCCNGLLWSLALPLLIHCSPARTTP